MRRYGWDGADPNRKPQTYKDSCVNRRKQYNTRRAGGPKCMLGLRRFSNRRE